jgi:hypothetical protein
MYEMDSLFNTKPKKIYELWYIIIKKSNEWRDKTFFGVLLIFYKKYGKSPKAFLGIFISSFIV